MRNDANLNQLLVLANMESYNAILIKQGKSQAERMQSLHELAVQQMTMQGKVSMHVGTVCLLSKKP